VVNVDEMGPIAARSYPGPSWSEDSHRPHFRPSYHRNGYVWAYGALIHREGKTLVKTCGTRNTKSWLDFLDSLEGLVPEGKVYLIVDGLPLHWTLDTMLWNWGHERFEFVAVPKGAAWLNLIEGLWKIVKQRSLDGRNCRDTSEVEAAIKAGVDDWNRHPTPFIWGREPKPQRHLKRAYVYRI
jgi:hypothetical protein